MIVREVKLKFRNGRATLVQCGDDHLGCPSCCMEAIDKRDRKLKRMGWQWIHVADIIDGVIPGDKRYDVDFCKSTLLDQMRWAESRIERNATNCVGMVEGNHEGAPSKYVGPVSKTICENAGIPFLTQTAYIRFRAPKGECVAFVSHYMPSCNSSNPDPLARQSMRLRTVRNKLSPFEADLKLGGHIHQFLCHPPLSEDRLILDGVEVKKRAVEVNKQWIVVSPAMFLTYTADSNYAQARLCRPTDIGWAEIDFDEYAKIIEVRHILGDGSIKNVYKPMLVDA